ncbi:RING finger protein 141-like [Ctenocephalides felis]|uniref:RING finger protein 141-like n=1 Tax=Ctenocephalides felis TaxID=7515 RepID=UPI000E6E5462|nr:RING finger protein 141-like [Ctenocephalides felis]
MGQNQSFDIIPDTVETVKDEIKRNAKLFNEISSMSYDDFLKSLRELNALSNKCLDSNTQLVFVVKKGTDSTVLWKGTVRIACAKIDIETKKVLSYKLFNLLQFRKVFNMLQTNLQVMIQSKNAAQQAGSSQSSHDITTSLLYDKINCVHDDYEKLGENLNECCICLERKSEVMLPCAHSYCLPCIEQWNVNNKTCPLCRETLQSTEDTWVISEMPEADEINEEIKSALLSLSQDTVE